MGIIWWIAGAVGIVLSRNGNRSVIPSVLIMLTAVSFFGHAQHVPNSEKLHSYFGYMLMAGGFSRIIEICFVWKEGNFSISPFQYIPPLVCACTQKYARNLTNDGIIDIDAFWFALYGFQ